MNSEEEKNVENEEGNKEEENNENNEEEGEEENQIEETEKEEAQGNKNKSTVSNVQSNNQSKSSTKTNKSELYKNPIPKFESASTLQNSGRNIIFNKAPRFEKIRIESADCIYDPIIMEAHRAPGIGYGNRQPLSYKNTNPGPSHYKFTSVFEDNIKHSKGPKLSFRNEVTKRDHSPGPGAYKNTLKWKKDIGIGITSRHSYYFDDIMRGRVFVSPQRYEIKRNFVESNRYGGISFGYGNRCGIKTNSGPGVGSYNLPSSFDLKKGKLPIN